MELVKPKELLPDNVETEDEGYPTLDEDFAYVQKNYKNLINEGMDTLKSLKDILSASDDPFAADALVRALTAIANMNKDMINNHKTKANINKDSGRQNPTELTQQNIFVGSSEDLQKLLKGNAHKNK